jgi:DNA invertase Pin-like site-specific DNA recombinase
MEDTTTVGYIRVSTKDQNYERQRDELEQKYDVDEWFEDVKSGASTTGRDGYNQMLDSLDGIDTIVIDEVSRVGRNLHDVSNFLNDLDRHDVKLKTNGVLPDFDPDDPMSRAMIEIGAAFAQLEHKQLLERLESGMERAQRQGKHCGRPPTGYELVDGFPVPDEPTYAKVNYFIRAVNRGCPKSPAARFFDLDPQTGRNILKTSARDDDWYDETYVGDEVWRKRKAQLQAEHPDKDVSRMTPDQLPLSFDPESYLEEIDD